MTNIPGITREPLPSCSCDFEADPGHTLKCWQPAVAKWTFPDGTVFYACDEHDGEFELSYGVCSVPVPESERQGDF